MIDLHANLHAEIEKLRAQLAESRGDRCNVCDDDGLIYVLIGEDAAGHPSQEAQTCPECGGTKSGYASAVTKERDESRAALTAAEKRIGELEAGLREAIGMIVPHLGSDRARKDALRALLNPTAPKEPM